MAIYNILHTSLKCPRCGVEVEATVNCYFGNRSEMDDLKIGDRYPWWPGAEPQNGGRPAGGSVDGEGYIECPHCHKDTFLRVLVRGDVIVGVEPDETKPGYIPD
jgi:DNA-directed RNA polymerase subunit RPC12/RpoP